MTKETENDDLTERSRGHGRAVTKVIRPSSKEMNMWQGASRVARMSLGSVDQLHIPRSAPPD
jgi:hypothetical protein